jgi:tRNA 2-selenouridine synthase
MLPSAQDAVIPLMEAAAVLEHPAARVVDLRSPAEFEDDHLPGAVNLPLFDDTERAVVGLLYKRASPEVAFESGMGFVRDKVVELVASIGERVGVQLPLDTVRARAEELAAGGIEGLSERLVPEPVGEPPTEPLVLHCWRGGLRSQSVIALLRRLGLDQAVGLAGGYKAYRARVRAELEGWQAPPCWVLRGLTGVGKTLVLRELERLRPGTTLDLELAAGHRSSLLGMVGLEPVSQKTFESRLAARLRNLRGAVIVMEGESRRVGDAIVPARIWEALRGGTNLLLEADVPRRVEVLLDDYLADPSARPKLREQLAAVQRRIEGPPVDLLSLFDDGREPELVEVLLERYYDPLYGHSEKGKHYAARIDAADPLTAARAVAEQFPV